MIIIYTHKTRSLMVYAVNVSSLIENITKVLPVMINISRNIELIIIFKVHLTFMIVRIFWETFKRKVLIFARRLTLVLDVFLWLWTASRWIIRHRFRDRGMYFVIWWSWFFICLVYGRNWFNNVILLSIPLWMIIFR